MGKKNQQREDSEVDQPTGEASPSGGPLLSSRLDSVDLDGHAALKIIKHCQESFPKQVTGALLGMDQEATLEVTNCFPSLSASGDEETQDADNYQLDMMKCLRLVNVDCFTVGWYKNTYLSGFLNESAIESQFNYHTTLEKCVCIIYDPLLAAQGRLCLKALRLTDKFVSLYREKTFTLAALKNASMHDTDIYEEIPIRIKNSLLIQGALADQQRRMEKAHTPSPASHLNFPSSKLLEKHVEYMIDCVDELTSEYNKLQYHQRNVQRQKAQQEAFLKRREEGDNSEDFADHPLFRPIHEPSRLDALLLSTQITSHAKQMNDLTQQSLTRAFHSGRRN